MSASGATIFGIISILTAVNGWAATLSDFVQNNSAFVLDWNTRDAGAEHFLIAVLAGGVTAIATRNRLACIGFGLGVLGLALFVLITAHAGPPA